MPIYRSGVVPYTVDIYIYIHRLFQLRSEVWMSIHAPVSHTHSYTNMHACTPFVSMSTLVCVVVYSKFSWLPPNGMYYTYAPGCFMVKLNHVGRRWHTHTHTLVAVFWSTGLSHVWWRASTLDKGPLAKIPGHLCTVFCQLDFNLI